MWINGFYPLSCAALLLAALEGAASPATLLAMLATLWINVVLHELGHAVTTCATGGAVTGLKLYPWHGVTTVQRPEGHLAYAAVVAAGPALGIAAALGGIALLSMAVGPVVLGSAVAAMHAMLWLGIADNALNLIPVGVLDGRRLLREVSAWRVERARHSLPQRHEWEVVPTAPPVAVGTRRRVALRPAWLRACV